MPIGASSPRLSGRSTWTTSSSTRTRPPRTTSRTEIRGSGAAPPRPERAGSRALRGLLPRGPPALRPHRGRARRRVDLVRDRNVLHHARPDRIPVPVPRIPPQADRREPPRVPGPNARGCRRVPRLARRAQDDGPLRWPDGHGHRRGAELRRLLRGPRPPEARVRLPAARPRRARRTPLTSPAYDAAMDLAAYRDEV